MLLNQDIPRALGAKRVSAVIFDWAGTTVDFGSLAPVRTLERVFGEAGVPILEEEARRDMGIAKRDHIAAILGIPRVKQQWEKRRSRNVSPGDVDILYERFIPLQFECLKQYSKLIAGVPELTQELMRQGVKIGSTTGYTRAMLDVLLTEAAKQGYCPEFSFSPEDVGAGRPHPFMIYEAAVKLKVYPLAAVIKVGDTESDIQEGLNAGVWSVGVTASGNSVGLPEAAFSALDGEQRALILSRARKSLQDAGAHYVIDSLAQVTAVIDDVGRLLA
jgi:phosphonoacetaldehyde hydrolase